MSTDPNIGGMRPADEGTFEAGGMGAHEEVRESAKGVKEKIRGVAEAAMHGRGSEIKEELNRIGSVAKDAAYEQMEHLRKAGMEKARQLEDRITEQPLKSVLIACGLGFLLGVLWMRD